MLVGVNHNCRHQSYSPQADNYIELRRWHGVGRQTAILLWLCLHTVALNLLVRLWSELPDHPDVIRIQPVPLPT